MDPREEISAALKREFGTEATNSLQTSRTETQGLERQRHAQFSQQHRVVCKGSVDDPQDTENARMRAEAVNRSEETGEVTNHLPVEAGGGAGKGNGRALMLSSSFTPAGPMHSARAEKRGAHWR